MIGVELSSEQYLLLLQTVDKQIRFGTMKALNKLILLAQARQRHHQQRVFKVRHLAYWRQAVKVPKGGFATRKRLVAQMLIDPKGRPDPTPKMDIWQRQEYGGTRRPVAGRKRLALPTKEAKRTQRGIVKRAEHPKRLKRVFFVQFRSGAKGLFQRIGRRQRAYTTVAPGQRLGLKQDPNVRYLFFLIKSAPIDAVYDFYENARVTWRANMPRILSQELQKAFATARVRGYRG